MRGDAITLTTHLVVEECCNCGVPFAIPNTLHRDLREEHRTFYCPNGHGQSYRSETEAEKLRKQLALAERRAVNAIERAEAADRSAAAARGQVTKMRNRAAAGVCQCCHRSFVDVARHMKSKHPNYAQTAASG